MDLHAENVGLIMRGKRCVVAELQPKSDGTGRATLLCYTVGEYRWVEMELPYSPPLLGRYWFGDGVISHGGMLWWIDLSYGILACDPLAEEPELLHVPFPRVLDELPVELNNRSAYTCVKVSGGRLRYVQIHGSRDVPVVRTWTLADPASAGEWTAERSVCLADIWADNSYLETMLPRSIPALALLHPVDPDKLYFFLDSCIFAIDMRRRMVVEFSEFRMPEHPSNSRIISSHFVHAWEYQGSHRGSPDFVPTSLRKKKEIASKRRLFAMMHGPHESAVKLNGSRNSVVKRHQLGMRWMIPTHVFKRRREISKADLDQLALLTINEAGSVA